jgi:hypothetical protein
MTTWQYIIRIIKRFGLFNPVDVVGLFDEITNYQIEVFKKSDFRARNIELLNRVESIIKTRRAVNLTLDSWVTELQNEYNKSDPHPSQPTSVATTDIAEIVPVNNDVVNIETPPEVKVKKARKPRKSTNKGTK